MENYLEGTLFAPTPTVLVLLALFHIMYLCSAVTSSQVQKQSEDFPHDNQQVNVHNKPLKNEVGEKRFGYLLQYDC